MNARAAVAIEKRTHPERFCSFPGCLWRTTHLTATGEREPNADCLGGRCPRHPMPQPDGPAEFDLRQF